jgi:hypothetical protein
MVIDITIVCAIKTLEEAVAFLAFDNGLVQQDFKEVSMIDFQVDEWRNPVKEYLN